MVVELMMMMMTCSRFVVSVYAAAAEHHKGQLQQTLTQLPSMRNGNKVIKQVAKSNAAVPCHAEVQHETALASRMRIVGYSEVKA